MADQNRVKFVTKILKTSFNLQRTISTKWSRLPPDVHPLPSTLPPLPPAFHRLQTTTYLNLLPPFISLFLPFSIKYLSNNQQFLFITSQYKPQPALLPILSFI